MQDPNRNSQVIVQVMRSQYRQYLLVDLVRSSEITIDILIPLSYRWMSAQDIQSIDEDKIVDSTSVYAWLQLIASYKGYDIVFLEMCRYVQERVFKNEYYQLLPLVHSEHLHHCALQFENDALACYLANMFCASKKLIRWAELILSTFL